FSGGGGLTYVNYVRVGFLLKFILNGKSKVNANSTNARNGKNRSAIFTILCHLRCASRSANGAKTENGIAIFCL
ncbi:MAG: hypothetical protein ACKO7R_03080, partial [Pseudanabaena sp.]